MRSAQRWPSFVALKAVTPHAIVHRHSHLLDSGVHHLVPAQARADDHDREARQPVLDGPDCAVHDVLAALLAQLQASNAS